MQLTITIKKAPQDGKRGSSVKVATELSDALTMEQLKNLWFAEQTLNGLPGNLRVHIELSADATAEILAIKEK